MDSPKGEGLTRRGLLKVAAKGAEVAAVAGLAALLAGCGETPSEAEIIKREDEDFRRLSDAIKSNADNLKKKIQDSVKAFSEQAKAANILGIIRELRTDTSNLLSMTSDNAEAVAMGKKILARDTKNRDSLAKDERFTSDRREYFSNAWGERASKTQAQLNAVERIKIASVNTLSLLQYVDDNFGGRVSDVPTFGVLLDKAFRF